MHILTKFLVVAAAILSVLLSGMSITYAANVSKVKTELATEKARVAQANIAHGESLAELEREKQGAIDANQALVQERTQLATSRDALKGDVARLQAEVNKLQILTVTHEARIDEFRAVIETNTEIMKVQSDELGSIRGDLLLKTRREIELTDRVDELTAINDALNATNRALQEQIQRLREGGSSVANGGQTPMITPAGLKARVTNVTDGPADAKLIEIDAGSSDGLREGMKLDIVRNGSWVASVTISRVDLNESIARIEFIGQGNAVRSGDAVQSRN